MSKSKLHLHHQQQQHVDSGFVAVKSKVSLSFLFFEHKLLTTLLSLLKLSFLFTIENKKLYL